MVATAALNSVVSAKVSATLDIVIGAFTPVVLERCNVPFKGVLRWFVLLPFLHWRMDLDGAARLQLPGEQDTAYGWQTMPR